MKDLSIGILKELYGSQLTDKQKSVIESYYDYDLSLGEIAEIEGVSRQAVMDTLKKSEKTLQDCEDGIGMLRRNLNLKSLLEKLLLLDSVSSDGEAVSLINKMLELL